MHILGFLGEPSSPLLPNSLPSAKIMQWIKDTEMGIIISPSNVHVLLLYSSIFQKQICKLPNTDLKNT